MIIPSFKEEQKLRRKGHRFIVGIDEAGRGPLAGPVVAAAVIFSPQTFNFYGRSRDWTRLVKSSKKLTARKREELYKIIIKEAVDWKVGIVSEKVVDKINIFQASLLAIERALRKLKSQPDFLLVDGKFTLINYPVNQKAVVRGDEKVFSISAASIIAKVTRDRIMKNLDKKYPVYGFKKHKGYGTRLHFARLNKYGPCQIHRQSFKPVKKLIA